MLCEQTDTSCSIGARTGSAACSAVCATSPGQARLSAGDTLHDMHRCDPRPLDDTCEQVRSTTSCTCSRPQ